MRTFIQVLWLVVIFTFLFPLYWMISMSFKSKSEAYVNPFGIPRFWDWYNFSEALSKYHPEFRK